MNTRIDEIRKFSEWVINALAPSITLCKQHLGISTFGYRRFLPNGKSFGFSDHPLWNQIFLQKFTGFHIPEYEKDFQRFITSGENYVMRKGLPPENNLFLKTLYEINLWNTLVIYIKNPETLSVEAFFFGATCKDTHLAEMYIRKLDFIHHWIKLIQPQLADYITKKVDTYFSTTLIDPICLRKLQDFLCLEKHQLSTNDLRSLSKREREVASLLIKGYKRRDIAYRLSIAPKTVDANIEHIKSKTHTLSKIQFLKLLQDPVAQEILKFYEA